MGYADYREMFEESCRLEARNFESGRKSVPGYASGHNGELFDEINSNPAYGKVLMNRKTDSPTGDHGFTDGQAEAPIMASQRIEKAVTTLNLENILVGDINRLRYISRFSTALVAHRENVAEHSFYVAWYSMLITQDVNRRLISSTDAAEPYLDMAIVLQKAIVHDAEEARTGDIYRPFKISNPELTKLLHECARNEMKTLLMDTSEDRTLVSRMYHLWDRARDGSPEGCVVAFADYLGVLAHMLSELRTANFTMRTHYESMVAYSQEFQRPEYQFLEPLVSQATAMVHDLLGVKQQKAVGVDFFTKDGGE